MASYLWPSGRERDQGAFVGNQVVAMQGQLAQRLLAEMDRG